MNVLLKRAPTGRLSGYLKSLWIMSTPDDGDTLVQMPSVRARLGWVVPNQGALLHDGTGESNARHVEGPVLSRAHDSTRMVTFLGPGPRRFIGVEFLAGGEQAFFTTPLSDLPHPILSLSDVWDAKTVMTATRRLEQAIEQSMEEALDVLESVLEAQLCVSMDQPLPVQRAIAALAVDGGQGAIASAAARAAMTDRQFREVVYAGTGLTPKRYARILRFTRALMGLHHQNADTDTALAAECGYFDQAHFHHDFKSLSGMSPSDYRKVHGDSNHAGCPFTAFRERLAAWTHQHFAFRPSRAKEADATHTVA